MTPDAAVIPGLEWVRRAPSRRERIVRAAVLSFAALSLWPFFLAVSLPRLIRRSLISPPLRLGRWGRIVVRSIAYVLPLAMPAFAGAGSPSAAIATFVIGNAALLAVLILCQPAPLEQRIVVMLLWFWIIVEISLALFIGD